MAKEQKAFYLDSSDVEWAQVAPNKVVVATKDRAWLHHPSFAKNRFAQPMTGTGNVATTRKLLDGAIASAKRVINSNSKLLSCATLRWIWQLASAYHLHHATLELIEEACVGFATIGRWSLAEWAALKANEEKDFDLLILQEIKSMGYNPQAVVKAIVPPVTGALIDYLTRSVRDWNPIDCVGYSYTMERLAISAKKEYVQEEIPLPLEVNATYKLRLESSIDADIERAEEIVEEVAKLAASERIRVAIACYETALICLSPSIKGRISDWKLQQLLEPLKLNNKVPN